MESKIINTPYDDVFRTLLNDCPRFIIPVINKYLNKDYELTDDVVLNNNELFVNQQGGTQDKIITDSDFSIKDDLYQIECQSTVDGTMIIRMWNYGSQIAMKNAKYDSEKGVLNLKFPDAAVMCLRHNSKTPNYTTINVEFPAGKHCSYNIPNIKIQEITLDEIFEEGLFFIIPFHIFAYENRFKSCENNDLLLAELEEIYSELFSKLNECVGSGISECEKGTIIDMSKKVIKQITKKYPKIKKGLGDIMGGKILEYNAKTIKNEGIKEGEFRGKIKILYDLVKDGVIDIKEAAKRMNLSEDEFISLMEKAKEK